MHVIGGKRQFGGLEELGAVGGEDPPLLPIKNKDLPPNLPIKENAYLEPWGKDCDRRFNRGFRFVDGVPPIPDRGIRTYVPSPLRRVGESASVLSKRAVVRVNKTRLVDTRTPYLSRKENYVSIEHRNSRGEERN